MTRFNGRLNEKLEAVKEALEEANGKLEGLGGEVVSLFFFFCW